MHRSSIIPVIALVVVICFAAILVITALVAIKQCNWELLKNTRDSAKDIVMVVMGYYFIRSYDNRQQTPQSPRP